MDVGYHRYKESTSGKGSYIEKAGELIANCKQLKDKNDADITAVKQESKGQKSDPNAAKYHFRVNEQACYDMVIITSKNSGSKRKAADMLCLADKQSSNIWVLSEGDHPNEYKNIADCDFKPRTAHWEELVRKIKEIAHFEQIS